MKASTRTPMILRVLAAVAAAGTLVAIAPAGADQAHPRVVSERPVSWTPHILDGTVTAITVVGGVVVVGGTFTGVTDADRRDRVTRRYLLGFELDSGRLTRLRPALDGPVYALAPGPAGTIYVGGAFWSVNGEPQRGVTQLRLDTGARVREFRTRINWGEVLTIASRSGKVYLGGTFSAVNGTARAGLARVDGATGAFDGRFDAGLRNDGPGRLIVRDLALAPDGRRLAAIGGFTHTHGRRRSQLAMLNTNGEPLSWYTDAFRPPCAPVFDNYVRGVDFAPDGSYFVVVTTGGRSGPELLCDTAARFDTAGSGRHRPRWVNHTGGYSLYSVSVTGPAVYVGGHQRWHDNPLGRKSAGPGAVPREGIAALHPGTGKALPWNPGRARGVGVQAFAATRSGLLVGSDTTRLGGTYHARIGMFPLP